MASIRGGQATSTPSLSLPQAHAFRDRLMSQQSTPGFQFSTDEERAHIRRFIRQLLEAFIQQSDSLRHRFNLSHDFEPTHAWNKFFRAQRSDLGDSVGHQRNLRQLHVLHQSCIEGGADKFASVLLSGAEVSTLSRRKRISAALSQDKESSGSNSSSFVLPSPVNLQPITVAEAFRVLRLVTSKFQDIRDPGKNKSLDDVDEWVPDWRCQSVLWSLIKRLGDNSPPAILAKPFQELKESVFACLFERNFIDNVWEQCTFSKTLWGFVPRPLDWDSDLSWLGVAFFVSLPLTGSFMRLRENDTELHKYSRTSQLYGQYWMLFFIFFIATAVGMILFYSLYRSTYSTRLMRRAAVGTEYTHIYKNPDGLKRISTFTGNLNRVLSSNSNQSDDSDSLDAATELNTVVTGTASLNLGSPSPRLPSVSAPALPTSPKPSSNIRDIDEIVSAEPKETEENIGRPVHVTAEDAAGIQSFFDDDSHKSLGVKSEGAKSEGNYMRKQMSDFMSPSRAIGFESDDPAPTNSGASLRLYQASMFVQRIYGSSYFDESWAFGLSESQLYEAIRGMLGTDSTLGRQYSAFSFAAIAVSSRGVPASTIVANTANPTPDQLKEKFLADLGMFNFGIFSFLGGLAFISGITAAILADSILRQMAFSNIKSNTHFFAIRFGFFIRVVGSLNSLAGMFLSSALMHFLLSIFKVNIFAVLILSATWLICGTMCMESFFSNYHFWRMSECLDDISLIAEPDVLSPSPLIGSLQYAMRQLRRLRGKNVPKNNEGSKGSK